MANGVVQQGMLIVMLMLSISYFVHITFHMLADGK